MHYIDFANMIRREVAQQLAAVEANILNGSLTDLVSYREAVARRDAYRKVVALVDDSLSRDEARSSLPR